MFGSFQCAPLDQQHTVRHCLTALAHQTAGPLPVSHDRWSFMVVTMTCLLHTTARRTLPPAISDVDRRRVMECLDLRRVATVSTTLFPHPEGSSLDLLSCAAAVQQSRQFAEVFPMAPTRRLRSARNRLRNRPGSVDRRGNRRRAARFSPPTSAGHKVVDKDVGCHYATPLTLRPLLSLALNNERAPAFSRAAASHS